MYYKLFMNDLRSPFQGGSPVFDGKVPFDLPTVELDTGPDECSAGWNFVSELSEGFRMVGLWPDGWPSEAFVCEPSSDVIARGKKHRSSGGRIVRRATDEEIGEAVAEISQAFQPIQNEMLIEQKAWRLALSRPQTDKKVVRGSLGMTLEARGLDWKLKEFPTEQATWSAWSAWAARATRAEWAATWATWASRAAWDALVALSHFYAVKKGWIDQPADRFTIGIRTAYMHGLHICCPTGNNELGWAMVNS